MVEVFLMFSFHFTEKLTMSQKIWCVWGFKKIIRWSNRCVFRFEWCKYFADFNKFEAAEEVCN